VPLGRVNAARSATAAGCAAFTAVFAVNAASRATALDRTALTAAIAVNAARGAMRRQSEAFLRRGASVAPASGNGGY
jgi:hypothetical protein